MQYNILTMYPFFEEVCNPILEDRLQYGILRVLEALIILPLRPNAGRLCVNGRN
jgi:hypothetical protein